MSSKVLVGYDEKKNKFTLQCPYHLNNLVRSLPNRRYLKGSRQWEAPALLRNAEHIANLAKFGQAELLPGVAEVISKVRDKSRPVVNKVGFPAVYPFKTNPFNHQRNALNSVYGLDQAGLLMEMGTGKTKVIIDLSCCYFIEGKINALMVVCPVAIRRNWVREMEVHAPSGFRAMVCDPGTKSKERKIEQFITERTDDLKVLIVGTESLSQRDKRTNKPTGKSWRLAEKFLLCHNAMMAVDESHLIKGHDSNRSRNVVSLGLMAKMRLIATGTPIANGVMDLYMQFEFLSTHIVGVGDYYSYRNRYAVMGGFENKQIVGYDNVEELMDIVKPWIFQCTKEDALPDLPPKVYQKRHVKLLPEQKKVYDEVKKNREAKLPALAPDGSNYEVVTELILTRDLALQQIVGGYVSHEVDEEENTFGKRTRRVTRLIEPHRNPKVKEIINIADEHPGPMIIWAKFRPELGDIVEALRGKYGEDAVVEYHGGVDSDQRDINEDLFKTGKARFFVANQATGGVGLTLNIAKVAVFVSNSFKYIDRVQAEDRNHRIGQEGADKILYIDLVAEQTVDEDICESIGNKQDMATFVKERLAT